MKPSHPRPSDAFTQFILEEVSQLKRVDSPVTHKEWSQWLKRVRKLMRQASHALWDLRYAEVECLNPIRHHRLPAALLQQLHDLIHQYRRKSIIELLGQCPVEMRVQMLQESLIEAMEPTCG